MLDNTQSIICAFGLAAAAPRSPYRHLELCGIALTEFDPKVLQNLLQSFALSTVLLLLGLVITFLLTLRIGKEKNTPILRFACIFSNAAYMGFPLIQALFGAEGLLYASAYVTLFNILLWTVGYAMVSGKVRPGEVLHSILTTPVLWSVLLGLTLYLCRVNVPELIRQPLQLVGNMNTPLSMIITGMLIAGSKPEKLLGNREIYRIILIRMLFIPLVSFLLFRLLSVQGMVAEVVLLLEACPCAAITSVFAVQFGYNEDLAAGSVVITTFISIVVLPLCAMALTMMM
jgi:predicted permease